MRFSSQTRFNKELYEISAVLNYAIVQQLAFFAFVCITQLFLALRYINIYNYATVNGKRNNSVQKLKIELPYSGKFSRGAKFRVFCGLVGMCENKNHEHLNRWE